LAVDFSARHELVLAIAHEIGNHLGGIRLEAHLLDDDLDPRALARASVSLDSMAGRSGALLGLLRPLLMPEDRSPAAKSWTGILSGVQQELVDQGTRGVDLIFDLPEDDDRMAPPVDWFHHLLMAWLGASIAQAQSREGGAGRIRVAFVPGELESSLVFEDNAPEEDLSETAPRRERPLALAIARVLLGALGGRVEVARGSAGAGEPASDPLNRVIWHVPNGS
jgi:hypothetical protein